MTNTEIELERYKLFKHSKVSLYNRSVNMYRQGYPISSIINKLYPEFHDLDKTFTKKLVHEYVWKSIYDFVMKEKQQGN